MAKRDILTAIDIGTSSIKVLVADNDKEKGIRLLTKAEVSQFGIKNGEVYRPKNIAKTLASIKNGLEKELGAKLKEAIVSIGGWRLETAKGSGVVSASRADQKISSEDVKRVIQSAKASVGPFVNREILEVIPIEYIVNGKDVVDDPVGLEGSKLEVKIIVVAIFSPVIDDLVAAVSSAGFEIVKIVPSPLASAEAVLSEQQKELGSAVLAIGAANTSLTVFSKGKIVDFSVFPFGSSLITNDVALGLRTTIALAEKIKKEFGSIHWRKKGKKSLKKPKQGGKRIEIPEEGISVSGEELEEKIRKRLIDLFEKSKGLLKEMAGETSLPGGIIMTGGGAKLKGLVNFSKNEFELPVYLAKDNKVKGAEDPSLSTAAGLLLIGFSGAEGAEEEGGNNLLRKIVKMILP